MKTEFSRKIFVALILTTFTLLAGAPVSAQEKSPDDWQYSFELYLWAPKIQITPDGGDKITLKLKDILENLDMIFFGDIEMRKGDCH
ncbi:MAG: hypothetical protein OET41_15590, partial [Xanthomonadales bacterium]|nr:hypothetical protein [Xanthomonadales bacterium]